MDPRTGITRSHSEVRNRSRSPLLLSGPQTEGDITPPGVVVFPTDFSSSCAVAYPEILKLTASLEAELHFFHKTMHTIDPVAQSGVSMFGGGWVSVETLMDQPFATDHRSEAENYLQRAEQEGVQARFINENFHEPTSAAIVQYVKSITTASPLLAMVIQTSALASCLLGSVTRDVIQASPCPVYLASRSE